MARWLTLYLGWNFVALYGIWLQLHAVFVRYASLDIRALLGSLLSTQKLIKYIIALADSDGLDSRIYDLAIFSKELLSEILMNTFVFLASWFEVMTLKQNFSHQNI